VKKTLQIGITGGIGSGKSLVCKIFRQLGVAVYDADSHAKRLMTTDGILMSGIKKEFGDLAYHTDGMLNRNYLADHVFNNEQKLAVLNGLVHPRIKADYERWFAENNSSPYVLKEAALLFEAGTDSTLDKIIVVHAPEDLRLKRVLSRDPQRTSQQVKAIIGKQMPEEEKLRRADFVIINDETTLVIPQVLKLHGQFTTLAQE
jgi:dephospho-CoA kinase